MMMLTLLALAQQVAPAREYAIDRSHSLAEFTISFMRGFVRGRIDHINGTIVVVDGRDGPDVVRSSVAVFLPVAGITTGAAHRDEHLKSEDFFDAARYPYITFTSRSIAKTRTGFAVTGPFSMHGVTRTLTIPFTMTGPPIDDPHGQQLVEFAAKIPLARKDFGILGGAAHNSWFDQLRSATMGDTVTIELEVHGWRPDPAHPDSAYVAFLARLDSLGRDTMLARWRGMFAGDSARFQAAQAGTGDLVGQILLARGRTDDAKALMGLAAQLLPRSADALVTYGVTMESTSDKAGAIAAYQKALGLDSLDTRARARLARLQQ